MSDLAGPGYYAARGDPPGTVRHWDGARWTSEPMPPPPGWTGSSQAERFATFWIRVGAALLDGLIGLVLVVPFMIPWIIDIFEQIDAGVEADQLDTSVPLYFFALGFAVTIGSMLMVALLGGTPGKLILQLRITTEDGSTTPPGFPRALKRAIPQFLTQIPIVGPLVAIVVLVLNIVWVNTDSERRSAYDRLAGTRVVHKHHL